MFNACGEHCAAAVCTLQPEEFAMKFASTTLAALMLGALSTASAAPVVFSAQGADAAAILPTVNAFRNALGGGAPNANVAGSEINRQSTPRLRIYHL